MLIKRIVGRIERLLAPNLDRFLHRCRGVIHVGANIGNERTQYASLGLRVIWIEPIPEAFARLTRNITPYPDQKALNYLVTDSDDKEYDFHLASNDGGSSSILEFGRHAEIWPNVSYVRTIKLTSVTLPSLLRREQINLSDYDALVLDTQGSELLILRAAASQLHAFQFVKLEAATFEAYKGGGTLPEIDRFMTQNGFEKHRRREFVKCPSGGAYYDVVYRRSRVQRSTRGT